MSQHEESGFAVNYLNWPEDGTPVSQANAHVRAAFHGRRRICRLVTSHGIGELIEGEIPRYGNPLAVCWATFKHRFQNAVVFVHSSSLARAGSPLVGKGAG